MWERSEASSANIVPTRVSVIRLAPKTDPGNTSPNSARPPRQRPEAKKSLSNHFCPMCRISFKTEKERIAHVDARHVTDVRRDCNLCRRRFSNNNELNRHMNSHRQKETRNMPRRTDDWSIPTKNRFDIFQTQGNW